MENYKVIKNRTYKNRILCISAECDLHHIPYTLVPMDDFVNDNYNGGGWQIRFPWCVGDVACHKYTYGNMDGYVESYQFPWDEGDVSVLTPEEAADKIVAYYNELKEKGLLPNQ